MATLEGMLNDTYPNTVSARSVAEYLDVVKRVTDGWYAADGVRPALVHVWFRGQSHDWPLLPRVFRPVHRRTQAGSTICRYSEYTVLNAFLALYANYVTERFEEGSIELFAFMQHYGIPTRLLDWTESSLIGLYFAISDDCSNRATDDIHPVVWMMHPGGLNSLTSPATSGPFLSTIQLVSARLQAIGSLRSDGTIIDDFYEKHPEYAQFKERADWLKHPVALYPRSRANMRLATQKGTFTLHGTDTLPIDGVLFECSKTESLLKIRIDPSSVCAIADELRGAGVSHRSVFPDLTGLSAELCGTVYMR